MQSPTMRALVFASACLALAAAATIKYGEEDGTHYDQRQNGTENYRVNVDGVLVAIAPADALLSAAASADFGDLLDFLDYQDLAGPASGSEKPTPTLLATNATTAAAVKSSSTENQAKGEKPTKRKSLRRRLANFLLPLLRRNRHN